MPVVHLALARGVAAHRADAAVCPNGHRVPVAAADPRELAPAVDLPLPLGVAAGGHQRPVAPQSCAESPSRGNGDDTMPVLDIALTLRVPSACQNCSVAAESQCVRAPGVAGRVDIAGRHGDHVPPLRDLALSGGICSDGDHSAVGEASDGVLASSRQGSKSHRGPSFAPIPAESRRSGQ